MDSFKVQRIDCVFCSVIYNMGEMFTYNVIYCEAQGSGCSQSQSLVKTKSIYATPCIWRQICRGTGWSITVSTLPIKLILLSRLSGT
jgi:hypothetical protein